MYHFMIVVVVLAYPFKANLREYYGGRGCTCGGGRGCTCGGGRGCSCGGGRGCSCGGGRGCTCSGGYGKKSGYGYYGYDEDYYYVLPRFFPFPLGYS